MNHSLIHHGCIFDTSDLSALAEHPESPFVRHTRC
jgi:hypothetical protein